MGRGRTKEELEKTRKPFTSETAREAQKKSVASRNLHTMMVKTFERELAMKVKGVTKQEKITERIVDGAIDGDVQMIKIYTSVALSTQVKETHVEATDKGILITSVGAITPDEIAEL